MRIELLHIFPCLGNHPSNVKPFIHFIVFVDSSSSMKSVDLRPTKSDSLQLPSNRYGACLESLDLAIRDNVEKYPEKLKMTFINFTSSAVVAFEDETVTPNIVFDKKLNSKWIGGGTSFDNAFTTALQIMPKYVNNSYLVFLFLSDGEGSISNPILMNLKNFVVSNNVTVIVIGLAKEDRILTSMAQRCQGQYVTVQSSYELKKFIVNDVFSSIGVGNFGFYVRKKE